jgi:protein arginine kinase activator
MLCQVCQENPATVHVTDVVYGEEAPTEPAGPSAPPGQGPQGLEERHLCEQCAQASNLPQTTVSKPVGAEIWKLLQASAKRTRKEQGLACPDCGMTLAEFRQRGRLGCPRDYEVFMPQLRDLLERIHGATRHSGRVPGLDDQKMERLQRVNELQRQLEAAIREEAYETAAELRDQLKTLQQSS